MTRSGTRLHIFAYLLRHVFRYGKRSHTWTRIASSMSIPNVSDTLVHDAHPPWLLYLPSSDLRRHSWGQIGPHGYDVKLATDRPKHGFTEGFNPHLPTVLKGSQSKPCIARYPSSDDLISLSSWFLIKRCWLRTCPAMSFKSIRYYLDHYIFWICAFPFVAWSGPQPDQLQRTLAQSARFVRRHTEDPSTTYALQMAWWLSVTPA